MGWDEMRILYAKESAKTTTTELLCNDPTSIVRAAQKKVLNHE